MRGKWYIMRRGFDNEKYLKIQSEHIKQRIAQFGDKLYLEFGGKLFDDHHASRVLPGFLPDSKLRMLMQLRDEAEIVMVISAKDIEKNKMRGDLGITYNGLQHRVPCQGSGEKSPPWQEPVRRRFRQDLFRQQRDFSEQYFQEIQERKLQASPRLSKVHHRELQRQP